MMPRSRLPFFALLLCILASLPACIAGGGSSAGGSTELTSLEDSAADGTHSDTPATEDDTGQTGASPADPEPPVETEPAPPPPEAILAFDSTDDSILLRSSLTSPEAITDAGGSEEPTSTNSYHPELGMSPGAIAGGVPGCRFTAANIPALADLPEGQLSIEVERHWLAVNNDDTRSTGADHADLEYLLSHGSAGQSTAGKLYATPSQTLTWLFRAGEDSRQISAVNSKHSPAFARITLSWTPSSAELYLDGLPMASLNRDTFEAGNFSQLFIGNLVATTNTPFASPHHVRNLLVSSKPVTFSSRPMLQHVMLLGDSFAAGQPYFNTPNQYDGTIANNVLRGLAQAHFEPALFTVNSNGGGKLQDLSDDPLELDSNGAGKTREQALAENPTLVILVTGGNDISIFNEQTFTTDLRDHIQAYLGADIHPDTTVEKVIVTTTVSNALSHDPAVQAMGDIMRGLPAWWDNEYPDRAGTVHVIDAWSLFGGESIDSELFLLNDPVHPAPAGNIVYGQAITGKLLELLN